MYVLYILYHWATLSNHITSLTFALEMGDETNPWLDELLQNVMAFLAPW